MFTSEGSQRLEDASSTHIRSRSGSKSRINSWDNRVMDIRKHADGKDEDSRYLEFIYINNLCKDKLPVSVYLKTGIQLRGTIVLHDKNTLLLEGKENQLVYKQAVSSILVHRNGDSRSKDMD